MQEVNGQADQDSVNGRGVGQALHHGFGVGTAADHAVAQCPEQNVEHRDIGAGVKQSLRAEQGRDEREAHVSCIGKDAGKAEDRGPAVLAAGGEGQREHGAQCNGEDAQAERRQQVAQDFKAELHLIGVYDHGRDHDVDQQIGQRLFVFQLQDTRFDSQRAHPNEQKQHNDLLGADKCQLHKESSLRSRQSKTLRRIQHGYTIERLKLQEGAR